MESGVSSARIVAMPQPVRFTQAVFGFPDRLVTRLRYSDNLSINSTTGGIASYIFRANSTYDPDQTGTGHQPLYRDVYAGVYDNYSVILSKFRVQFINTSTSPFLVSVNVQDSTSSPSTIQAIEEESHGVSAVLTPLSGSKSFKEFVIPWSASQYLNIDAYSSQGYKTPVGTNPSDPSYFAVNAATVDSSTALITFRVILEYVVLWTELTEQALN
jgi:hypothetical protein